jgi:hypothetical protein
MIFAAAHRLQKSLRAVTSIDARSVANLWQARQGELSANLAATTQELGSWRIGVGGVESAFILPALEAFYDAGRKQALQTVHISAQ